MILRVFNFHYMKYMYIGVISLLMLYHKIPFINLLILFAFRKTLVNRLNNLMKADKIGRLGNNNYLNSAYWINVARLVLITFIWRSEHAHIVFHRTIFILFYLKILEFDSDLLFLII